MKKKKVSIIDYGLGNLFSVQNALKSCGVESALITSAAEIAAAEHLIIPGVGAFQDGINGLKKLGLVEPILKFAATGKPVLGICLGMQLLFEESEEFGLHRGLGLIPGRVVSIPSTDKHGKALRLPHMGWNDLQASKEVSWENTLLENNSPGDSVYFAHSFMAQPSMPRTLAYASYGGYEIPAVIQKANIAGCQFHPEKSSKSGLTLLATFVDLVHA